MSLGLNSALLSSTVVSGNSFSPVHQQTADNCGFFVTHTDLSGISSSAGLPSSPQSQPSLPHISHRPMSPFEKAGIPLVPRSSTPAISNSAIRRPSSVMQNTPGLPRHELRRPSSSMGLVPVLSPGEDARYEPTLSWYESHYYYYRDKKVKERQQSISGGSGSFALASDEGSGAFFQSILGTRKISTYIGDHAAAMQTIRQMYDNKTAPPCLNSFLNNLIFQADEKGLISFGDVAGFLCDLVPPPLCEGFVELARQFLVTVGGASTIQAAPSPTPGAASATSSSTGPIKMRGALPAALQQVPWLAWKLPFPAVYNAVETMFVGKLEASIIRKCFDLCDVTKCGYILKDVFRLFRDEERTNALTSLPPQAGVLVPPPQLTYLVVRGTWRVFDKIALAEEEKARNSGGKGKKGKSKKGGNGPVTVPGKRQFHINYTEFYNAMKDDPQLLLAFLPYAIEVALTERLLST